MTYVTAWTIGCVCGFFLGVTIARPPRDRDPDWRRSFNHENTNRPNGPRPLKFLQGGNIGVQPVILNEGRTQRGNGVGAPTTPKPNIIPKGQGGPTNPPPQNP
jgi:hypothetical protein